MISAKEAEILTQESRLIKIAGAIQKAAMDGRRFISTWSITELLEDDLFKLKNYGYTIEPTKNGNGSDYYMIRW